MSEYPHYKAALAHVAPVFLNTQATVEKACDVIVEASRNGARLVAFPEAFVPGFPVWVALQAPTQGHDLFRALSAPHPMMASSAPEPVRAAP